MKKGFFIVLVLSVLWFTGIAGAATFNVNDANSFRIALNTAQDNRQDDIINVKANIIYDDVNPPIPLFTYSTSDGDGGHKLTINGNGHIISSGVQILSINTDNDNTGDDTNGDITIDNLKF